VGDVLIAMRLDRLSCGMTHNQTQILAYQVQSRR
jgi:hypothetical protein